MTYDDMPDEFDPSEVEILPRAELNAIADGLLRAHRPDRSVPNAEWLDDVAEKLEGKISVIEAKRLAARQVIALREGQATARVNRFLKTLVVDGGFQITEEWGQVADDPVAFWENDDAGKPHRVRVALRAMRANDWGLFVLHGRADAQHRFAAEMAMYDAAEWLAAQQGTASFSDWASAACPAEDAA